MKTNKKFIFYFFLSSLLLLSPIVYSQDSSDEDLDVEYIDLKKKKRKPFQKTKKSKKIAPDIKLSSTSGCDTVESSLTFDPLSPTEFFPDLSAFVTSQHTPDSQVANDNFQDNDFLSPEEIEKALAELDGITKLEFPFIENFFITFVKKNSIEHFDLLKNKLTFAVEEIIKQKKKQILMESFTRLYANSSLFGVFRKGEALQLALIECRLRFKEIKFETRDAQALLQIDTLFEIEKNDKTIINFNSYKSTFKEVLAHFFPEIRNLEEKPSPLITRLSTPFTSLLPTPPVQAKSTGLREIRPKPLSVISQLNSPCISIRPKSLAKSLATSSNLSGNIKIIISDFSSLSNWSNRIEKEKNNKYKLTYLRLINVNVEDVKDCVSKLLYVLSHSDLTELEELILKNIDIGPQNTFVLITALRKCKNLKHLILNNINASNQLKHLIYLILPFQQNLKILDIAFNHAGSESISRLSHILPKLILLNSFDISGNDAGPNAMEELVFSLRSLMKLTSLGISENNAGNNAIIELCCVFRYMPSLNLLKIGGNNMSEPAVIALAKELPSLQKLKRLDISKNHLQEKGILKIFDSIKNLNLEYLNIADNDFGIETMKKVVTTLEKISPLKELSLLGKDDSESRFYLEEFLAINFPEYLNIIKF